MSEPVRYRVGMASRNAHLFDVEARFPVGDEATVHVSWPLWTPGSYLIREYQRHVQELAFTDAVGRALPFEKVDKATWRVTTEGAREVVARYRVYAHEVTVRTAHLDGGHGYWNGACLFPYVAALRGAPAHVTVEAPEGWHVTTGLPRQGRGYLAADFDELVDSPFECGPDAPIAFEAEGKPHLLAVWGRPAPGPYDLPRFVDDVKKIVAQHASLFGGLPYSRYAFLLHLVPNAHGGLEHALSSTCLGSSYAFSTEAKYVDLLELVSHEFFHLWNVKRIHPEALGPFDYAREAHTRSLWVVEGWTSYYDRLALRRAGLMAPKKYLEKLGEELTRLGNIPGRRRMSLAESSFDAWIKLYRPDENSVNSTVSYYLKGSIVALLLDLEIRRRTEGARSLDDAMRALFSEYGERGRGYPDAAVQPLVEQAAGVALDDFFARAVRGRDELVLDEALASVGLRLKESGATAAGERGGALGANVKQEGDRLRVTEALAGAAAERDGLYAGDQILACDGFRVDAESLKERLAARLPGEAVRLAVFRRDELREVTVILDPKPRDKVEVVAAEDPSPSAKAAYRAWLGADWPTE